jgi:hypothetical protein
MDWSLFDLLEWIKISLTGNLPSGRKPSSHKLRGYGGGRVPCLEDRESEFYKPPLLNIQKLLEVGFTVFLPKATLLSEGVSLTTSSSYASCTAAQRDASYFSVLKIHNIRVPALIGVNANERLAKQMIVVNVEIDPYIRKENDCYNELEQIVVKVSDFA